MVGFIFGGDTNVTPERLARERALAEAMLARGISGGSQNAWEGLGKLANAVAGRFKQGRVDEKEAEGRRRGSQAFREALATLSGAGMAAPPVAAPAASAAAPTGNIDPAVIERMESGGDPTAVSPAGAAGLMQIMPETALDPGFGVPPIGEFAADLGLSAPPSDPQALQAWLADPANAEANRQFGVAYLRAMENRFGANTPEAAAAYNAGPGAVERFGGVPPFEETQNYVAQLGAAGQFDPARIQAAIGQSDPTFREMSIPGQPGAMPAQPGGNVTAAIMDALGNEWLSDSQRGILEQALATRLKGPETMTPYQAAQLGLAERRLALQAAGQGGFAPTVINTGDQSPGRLGTIPQGFAVYGDGTPENPFRMEPIPGGPKDTSAATAAANEQAARAGNLVIEDVARLRNKIESAPWYSPVTGMAGDALGMVPGTNAFDARALQTTITANIGFDRLQQMREASPTGGALGAVSVQELQALQAVLGNISLSQSETQLLENLDRLDRIYRDILKKASAYPNAAEFGFAPPPPKRPDGITAEEWNAMTDEEKALFE